MPMVSKKKFHFLNENLEVDFHVNFFLRVVFLGMYDLGGRQMTEEFWIWHIKSNWVECADFRLKDYQLEAVEPVMYDLFLNQIYIEDYPEVRQKILSLMAGEIDKYQVSFRIRTSSESPVWISETVEITDYDQEGRPIKAKGVTCIEQNKMNREKRYRAFELDVLTQLPNDIRMKTQFLEILKEAELKMKLVCAVAIEITSLIEINKKEGRPMGDYLLRRTSDFLKELPGVLGRLGPGRFLVIFTGQPVYHIEKVLEDKLMEIRHAANQFAPSFLITYQIYEYWGESVDVFWERLL